MHKTAPAVTLVICVAIISGGLLSCGKAPASPLGEKTLAASATLPMPSATQFPTSSPTSVATPSPSPTAKPLPTATLTLLPDGVIAVYPQHERQTIREVGGGNFIHWPHNTAAFEPVSEMNLSSLSPIVVRARMSLDLWEPINDDSDPQHVKDDRFIDEGPNRYTFEMLQRFQKEGKLIAVSAWDLPDWMVDFPDSTDQRQIRPEMFPEAVESILAWLKHARDEYGVTVSYISFNEADGGYHIQLSSRDYAQLIRTAAPMFAAEQLTVKWLLADTANMGNAVSYAKAIWSNEDIRTYLGPLAFHSWDASASDSVLRQIGDFAQQEGLDAWCTEAGYAAFLWQRPEEFPTWENAQSLAAVYLRMLKYTRATTMLYWEMMAQDYPLNDGRRPYYALQFLTLFQTHFPAGAVILDTSEDPMDIKWTAARLPDGRFTVVVLNRGAKPRTLNILGLPGGDYSLTRLSESGTAVGEDLHNPGDSLPVNVQEESILFLQSR
jgi:O-glycosyl hydrolase